MSTSNSKRIPWGLIAYIGVAVIAIGVGTVMLTPEQDLPIYQPSDLNPALVDPAALGHEDHRILPFTLVNQLGDTVTEADAAGQVLVVDFFFTRCATICPMLTSNLKRVQDSFRQKKGALDEPQCDARGRLGVRAEGLWRSQWGEPRSLVAAHGSEKEVYKLARQSYFAALDEGDGGLQDFVHTENMVLVDTLGQLRVSMTGRISMRSTVNGERCSSCWNARETWRGAGRTRTFFPPGQKKIGASLAVYKKGSTFAPALNARRLCKQRGERKKERSGL